MKARTLVLALVVLLAAACGDNGGSASTTTAAAAASSTTTSAPATTTTTEPATTTTAASGCDAGPIPSGAVNLQQATADVDGDGTDDTISTYGEGSASDPRPWHVRLDRGASGAIDDEIADATDPAANVQPLGGAEISASSGLPPDGSGVEAFVAIGSGASDTIVAIFQYHECALVRLTGPDGTNPNQFAVGGTVTHLDGLRCDGISGGQRLVRLSATSPDGTTYDATEELLQVDNGQFVSPNPPIQSTITPSDTNFSDFSTITCGGVTPPP